MTRTQREKVKGKPLGYFHLCTDGLKDRKLFNSITEYAYGMTVLGLIVLKFDITIYAFSLMPNHIHIIMKGTGGECTQVLRLHVQDDFCQFGEKRFSAT